MSTTDNKLQVINSMTEDQLESLKNSEGKIPSLANQLIMTEGVEATLDNTVSLPIGSIFASAVPQTDSRFHLLDGTTISTTGIYADFVTLLKNLVTAGYSVTCTQTEFDTDVSNTGNCGKFVIDETAGTVRLPKITKFIQGLDSIANIGKSLEAGLPNITGSIVNKDSATLYNGSYAQGFDVAGALATVAQTTAKGYVSFTSDSTIRTKGISFNASNSNSIYGNSDTVQPQSTQYPYYIVLASGYKSSQSVNTDNIMKEVNLKSADIEYLSEAEKKKWFLLTHPVGSIYITMEEESPVDKYGGGWTRLADDKALWTASSSAGTTLDSKLPDIQGYLTGTLQMYGASNGAFEWQKSSGKTDYDGDTTTTGRYLFKASRYNPIYGDSAIVQPPAIKIYAWKRIS